MEVESVQVELLRLAAGSLTGEHKRAFIAEVTVRLCDGRVRQAEDRFGWNRKCIRKGLAERESGKIIPPNYANTGYANTGRRRFEDRHPKFADDVRDIAEPQTQTDPELKTDRRYLNLTSAEVRTKLITEKAWKSNELPAGRTMRRILNRMGYRLKKIQKGKPLKKTEHADAVFANIQAVKAAARDDPETLEISGDTKAKVAIGRYSRGGKNTHWVRRESRRGVGS